MRKLWISRHGWNEVHVGCEQWWSILLFRHFHVDNASLLLKEERDLFILHWSTCWWGTWNYSRELCFQELFLKYQFMNQKNWIYYCVECSLISLMISEITRLNTNCLYGWFGTWFAMSVILCPGWNLIDLVSDFTEFCYSVAWKYYDFGQWQGNQIVLQILLKWVSECNALPYSNWEIILVEFIVLHACPWTYYLSHTT